jgi:signal peptidase I
MHSRRSSSFLRWFGALLALVAVGALWYEFAPGRIGGTADYAVIDGISMNPKLHAGDLVILHPSSNYEVGDVVGYHNLQLGRLVLHRIVGMDGDRYVFKGDNNSFLDAYHPTRDQLVGKLWIQAPKAGNVFLWLHKPNHSAIAVAILAVVLLAGGGAGAARHRRRHGRMTAAKQRRRRRQPAPKPASTTGATGAFGANPATGRAILSTAGTIGAIFALLAVVAFTHKTISSTQAPGAYTQQGVYSYSGTVPPSTLYPSGRVATGQTVFTRIAHSVTTGFDYRFVSNLPHTVSGTARLEQQLQSSTGWTKNLPSPVQHFTGDHVHLTGTLDLTGLEQEMSRYATLTGITNDSFTVTLTPVVAINGNVGTTSLAGSTFAPTAITFALDNTSLRMENTAVPTMPGIATSSTASALTPSEPGVIAQSHPASVRLIVAHVGVTTLRKVSVIGLVVAVLLGLIGLLVLGAGGKDELASIRRRGGDLLVPVSSPPVRPAGGYVDVANFESLVHLARSYELVILHHQQGSEHGFYIDDDGSIYRYRVSTADAAEPEPAHA